MLCIQDRKSKIVEIKKKRWKVFFFSLSLSLSFFDTPRYQTFHWELTWYIDDFNDGVLLICCGPCLLYLYCGVATGAIGWIGILRTRSHHGRFHDITRALSTERNFLYPIRVSIFPNSFFLHFFLGIFSFFLLFKQRFLFPRRLSFN